MDKETSMNRKNKGSKDFYKSSSKGGGNSRKKMTVGVALAVLSAAAISVPVIIHYNETKGYFISMQYNVDVKGLVNYRKLMPKGSKVEEIERPQLPGYFFAGFYKDEDHTIPINPQTEISEDITVYLYYIFDEEHIFVSLNGKKLASGDVVDYNSTLTIKYIETEGHTKTSLKVNGQELVGETYLVTDKYETIEISYTEKINTYLVTFYDYNGSYINAIEVNWGTSASMTSPTREEDEMCSYVFSHWSESIGGDEADLGSVKEDMKVYAVYDVTYKEYSISNIPPQITVYYLSGTSSYTELQTLTSTDKVHYGDVLRFAYSTSEGKEYLSLFINNLDPMESETNSTTGYLTGAVAGNLSITYFEQTAVYEVNFYNEDGSELLLTTSAEWGTGVTYTGTIPTKEETVEGRYNFKGWVILDGKVADLSNIKQDMDLYANFEFIYTEYSITIPGNVVVTYISGTSKYDLGSEITSANSLHYGDEIKITLTPQENMVASFEIFGAEETDSGTYKITENATITYSEEHTYLTFAETTGGYSVSGLKDNSVKSILINICKLFRHFRTMV